MVYFQKEVDPKTTDAMACFQRVVEVVKGLGCILKSVFNPVANL